MITAPAASAAAYCSHSGYTATNEPMERCSSLSNGVLYNKQISGAKVFTTYSKTGGSAVKVRLGYSLGGSTHYAAAVKIGSGETKKKSWGLSSGSFCKSMTGLMKYNGGTYQTPTTHC
ncbi:hypothetical protein ABZ791_00030 [Streptomyces huasconensis]|uniref:Secreted protein n=1 Tax=Streptomyces huasconensis TaxID=1854574 RepID=A0ABV3LSQ6_9ACTN